MPKLNGTAKWLYLGQASREDKYVEEFKASFNDKDVYVSSPVMFKGQLMYVGRSGEERESDPMGEKYVDFALKSTKPNESFWLVLTPRN